MVALLQSDKQHVFLFNLSQQFWKIVAMDEELMQPAD